MKTALFVCVLLVGAGLVPVAWAGDSAVETFALEMFTRLAAVQEPCPERMVPAPPGRLLCAEYDGNFEIFKSMWDLKIERPRMRDPVTPVGPWEKNSDNVYTRMYGTDPPPPGGTPNDVPFSVSFLGSDEEHRMIIFFWKEEP